MSDYVISTDSVCDLPQSFFDDNEIFYAKYHYSINGSEHTEKAGDLKTIKSFYDALRKNGLPSTAQVNVAEYAAHFENILKQGKDILHLGFSGGLSGSVQSAKIAAAELNEKYPERKITVVDSLCAAPGFGLFVMYVNEKKKDGYSFDDAAKWAEENKLHIVHWFTVDDLFFLKRGGRVNAATAVVGSMLSIKPVLHVDNEGHLINTSKVRGRQMSIKALAEKLSLTGISPQKQTILIGHGDCKQDAEYLKSLVLEKFPTARVEIYYIGATIGAHSGPGTLALFYFGTER